MDSTDQQPHYCYDISFFRSNTPKITAESTYETFRFPLEPTLEVIASGNPDDPVTHVPLTQIQPGWLLRVGGGGKHPLANVAFQGFFKVESAGRTELF